VDLTIGGLGNNAPYAMRREKHDFIPRLSSSVLFCFLDAIGLVIKVISNNVAFILSGRRPLSSNDQEDQEAEPMEKMCESCGYGGEIENMVDCPKFAQDLEEKGFAPGWIHEDCCEDEFVNDPESCIEGCDNENLFENIVEHFEKCMDLEGMTKTELRGVQVFMSEDKTLAITSRMDEFLESMKPLNIVTHVFSDRENGIVYAKDNQKNINIYSLPLYEEMEERFSSLESLDSEQFCVKEGPFFLVYRFNNAVIGAMLAPRNVEEDLGSKGVEVAGTYKQKYLEAEDFFGVVLQPHREDLKLMIQKLSENDFIAGVLCPLLSKLGFKGVKAISFHGPGESGGDFYPFYKTNEFGKIVYYSAQAKAVEIHSKAGVKEGNVNQLIDQLKKLFRTPFKSFIDNTEKRISLVFVFCSQSITSEARDQLFHEIENWQLINLIDIDDVVTAVIDQGLSEQIMEYCRRKKQTA